MKTRKLFIIFVSLALMLGVIGVLPAMAGTAPQFDQGQSGTTLTAYKTAAGGWEKIFKWTLDKSVDPASWDLFEGDSGTSKYTVAVTKSLKAENFFVAGQICITNGGAVATQGLVVQDAILYKTGGGAFQDLVVTNVDISAKPVLAPGESYCYPYKIVFTPVAGATYKNDARITITNHSGSLGTPKGPSPDADFSLPSNPTLVNNSLHVDDTNDSSWDFNGSGSVSYDKKFDCDDEGKHDNTVNATQQDGTQLSDSASVEVKCYSLDVSKDADTSYTRTYEWTIEKSADQTELTLTTGQTFVGVNYTVKVNNTSSESDFAVKGTISVSNPAPIDAVINGVNDLVDGSVSADVDCGVSFPYTLGSGDTLECDYSADLDAKGSHSNTATATLQNYDYDSDGNGTKSGTTDFTHTIQFNFNGAEVTEIDECVSVDDSLQGVLGSTCAPKTYTYSRNVGPYQTCGNYKVDNIATFTTNDTGATGNDNWNIKVNVPCAGGCTLTQGYWKTHSKKGPAPYDDAWKVLPGGLEENTIFFLSGKSWYQIFWTPPAGNYYYILAHQYMAAKLNILNGAATTPAVTAAITWSETQFFNLYTPANVPAGLKKTAQTNAGLLDNYNNGLIGPGHCSE